MKSSIVTTSPRLPVVTYNAADFKGAEKFGVRPITPKELLEEKL
jgi:hypothetical protein